MNRKNMQRFLLCLLLHALFHLGKPETDHGSRCVARLASEIKFEEDDGTPFPGPRAEPILPSQISAEKRLSAYFKRQSKRYQYTMILKLCWTYFEAILAHLGPTYPTLAPFLAQLEPILSYGNHLRLP